MSTFHAQGKRAVIVGAGGTIGAAVAKELRRAGAEVVLSGYIKVRDGQNGFTAIVQHSMPTSQEPQSMNTDGARTLLPRMFNVAQLRAPGNSADRIRAVMAVAPSKQELTQRRPHG